MTAEPERRQAADPERGVPLAPYIERLRLTNFRSYASLSLVLGQEPVVLTGPNGAGKTNLLEAVSLLAPGQGLRRAPYGEIGKVGGDHDWIVSADVRTGGGLVVIGTGLNAKGEDSEYSGRTVRIDQQGRSPNALADVLEVVWLTPSSDGLFAGPASERRRFLDRLILCFDPEYRTRLNQFERAMRQRNRLLDEEGARKAEFEGLERLMAEMGTAIAATRLEAVARIRGAIEARVATDPQSPFPWAEIHLDGALEMELAERPAVDVEDAYATRLARARHRDRAAGRTLEGPHLSDLLVGHGPKELPAKVCSTGEQKALLINLVLAHAELVRRLKDGGTPLLLLDEIAAHLDSHRRDALFAELLRLGTQAWLTGTDREPFAALTDNARFFSVEDSRLTPIERGP